MTGCVKAYFRSYYNTRGNAKCLGGPELRCTWNSGKSTGAVPHIQPQWPQHSSKSTHGKPSLGGFEPLHCHLTWKQRQGTEKGNTHITHDERRSENEKSGVRVSKRTCVMTPWLQNIAFIPLCCRSQLQFVARQNQSALMLSAQQFVRKGALISMKCVKTAGKEISYWEYHCSVRCSLQLALPPMHTLILANIINNSLYYYKSLDY